jgi:peptidyl-prolyl cis-trans isomerase B (cyclophilin B)
MARRQHKSKKQLLQPAAVGKKPAPVSKTAWLARRWTRRVFIGVVIMVGLAVVFWLVVWPHLATTEPDTQAPLPVDKNAREDARLEKQFEELLAIEQQALEKRQLASKLEQAAEALEKVLAKAREDRPKDPVPQWLTGELMKVVKAEPAEILPYLRRAAKEGLERPRLFATLAQVQLQANQFEEAYRWATRALRGKPSDRYVWNAYVRAGFAQEKFAEVVRQADQCFPEDAPAWVAEDRQAALRRLAQWRVEQQLREAGRRADDLPRVRLIIQHRRFVRAAHSNQARIENTGKGEVIIELFEDQAPATVANFIDLVSRGFYDDTRFHQAEPAMLVAGGDPKSKEEDSADDGTGGPGYIIPDEFRSARARRHFRGSVSMVNNGPHTAGSQFFITLVPNPMMDGRFTVFGRVIRGQEVIDHINQGRTNKAIGRRGKIVPGDLLLRAEVIRKRPHPYRVIKE